MTDTIELSGRTFGGFVLREKIGEGSFGVVYCCEQPLLGRQAVVKVLHPKLHRDDVSVQRFLREAQLASRLDHPYAAHVYAFGVEDHDGLLWIAMERVQGVTLKSWLRDHGPMPLDRFVAFFERVAEVVQTAHERGIVHRDLKPSNMMVLERAGCLLPKLLDFGVAKLLDGLVLPEAIQDVLKYAFTTETAPDDVPKPRAARVGPSTVTGPWLPPQREGRSQLPSTTSGDSSSSQPEGRSRLTTDNATIGSPPYMSPEQWSNAVSVGAASDLYALAVVAFEALTGSRPFDGLSLADYADLHCRGKVPALGGAFAPALDHVLQRALAKRPEDRWGTALELARALHSASGIGPVPTDLPKIDERVRDVWLSRAPQPLAEAVAALDGARNAHDLRERVQELVRNLLRYLLAIAIASRAKVDDDPDAPELLELVRALGRRELTGEERLQLLRLLVRNERAHSLPELGELVTPDAEGNDALDPVLALYSIADHSGTDSAVRLRLRELLPRLNRLLHRTMVVFDYVFIVPRHGAGERWTGVRKQRREIATVLDGELADGHPLLLDQHGRVRVDLWPLAQVAMPSNGSDDELFVFEGRGRHGAQLIAAPRGITRDDSIAWAWVETHLIAEVELKSRIVGSPL
jgi:serine/threonine protein kinase